jgi:hypothetical protein
MDGRMDGWHSSADVWLRVYPACVSKLARHAGIVLPFMHISGGQHRDRWFTKCSVSR